MRFAATSVVSLAAVTLSVAANAQAPPRIPGSCRGTLRAADPHHQLRLTLNASRPSYTRGETAAIELVLTNGTDQEFRLWYSGMSPFDFSIRRVQDGLLLGRWSDGRASGRSLRSPRLLIVCPGQSVRGALAWNLTVKGRLLSRGSYRLIGMVASSGATRDSPARPPRPLRSPPVAISIT